MLTVQEILSFAAAAFAIIVVPGPSVLFIIGRGVALGRRAALATVVGNTLGALCMALLVSFGLGAIITRSLWAFTVMKWCGALYLVYLGIKAFRRRGELARAIDATPVGGSHGSIIREGFLVGVTNPKTIVFFGAVLPQFIHPERGSASLQMALLGVVFAAIAMLSDSAWGLLAGSVREWFAGSPRRLGTVGGIGGLTIAALGIRLALTGRHD